MPTARFEIVRTDADQPWHARFRAANGRIVWTTENYTRRAKAERAVLLLTNGVEPHSHLGVRETDDGKRFVYTASGCVEVRLIDERESTR